MGGDAPPLKRRRTNNAAMSAENVAQANSTLHVFTGQRHNRWMQGWVAQGSANNDGPKGTYVRPSAHPCDTDASTRPRDDPGNQIASVARFSNSAAAVRPANVPHVSLHSPRSGSSTASQPPQKIRAGVVHPALPSPVTSEDTTPPSMTSVHHVTCATAPKEQRPGLAHAHPTAASPNTTTSAPPVSSKISQSPSGPANGHGQNYDPENLRQRAISGRLTGSDNLHHIPLDAPPLLPSMSHGHLAQTAMMERLNSFQAKEASSLKLNDVDKGRITLLREAILRDDLFFVVLSQIHALRSTPHFMPHSARVQPLCFDYMSKMLCRNDQVSTPVLEWLTMFPAPILNIYFDTQMAGIYEPIVLQVARTLSLLPQHWDQFERAHIKGKAPPLVEELAAIFRLPSPVFRTAMFRTMARTIIPTFGFRQAEAVMRSLEYLHGLDQEAYAKGYRRSPEGQARARQAFYKALSAWKQHEEGAMQHNTLHLPKAATFSLSPDIINHFQPPRQPQTEVSVMQAPNGHAPPSQQTSTFSISHQRPSISVPGALQGPAVAPDRAQQELLMQQQMSQRASAQLRLSRTPPQPHPSQRRHLLLPGPNDLPRAQPTNPNPLCSALHHAHLRSPKPTLSTPAAASGEDTRFYRHVVNLALMPTRILPHKPVQTIHFNIPEDEIAHLAAYTPPKKPGEQGSFALTEKSQTYSLRCAAFHPSGYRTDSSWAVADTYWPESLFLEFNGYMLEPRRKLHYNRYLPIDLSRWVQAGDNKVQVFINHASTDTRPFEYALSVEVVGSTSASNIRASLTRIPADESIAAIKETLSTEQDDPEIAITSSSLTIRLFDPYSSSKIFDIPVRGSACTHKDCFDLETFLNLCKREYAAGPSVVDCWRCPLCRGDVRPQTLVVDGFLVQVREQLERKGLLNTRAITIEADGSWRPKDEEHSGVRSPSMEAEEREEIGALTKTVPDVIELD